MDYFKRYDENPHSAIYWNIPEMKQGAIAIIGGNAQSFRTSVKTAEYLAARFPVKDVRVVLPDALRGKLPELPGLTFLKSTESGSFADGEEMAEAINAADYSLMMGDVTKNSITGKAIRSACEIAARPLLITRDAVDVVAEPGAERLLMNENLVIMGSVAQLMKLLRAVYYPRMLTLSQSLVQVAETLHKFTLSYPVSIVTLHSGTILITKNGNVAAVPLEKTSYSPLTFWNGELAANIAVMNIYNPGDFVAAAVAGVHYIA